MSEAPTLSGGCLCGAVRFTAAPKSHELGACHCDMCRRWAAGPFLGIQCGDTLRFEKDADLAIYPSSAWAERGFCKSCGTSLFYKLKGRDYYVVSTEAFDDTHDFKLVAEVFIDEKPAYYTFAEDTQKMTGPEIMAAFSGSPDCGGT